MKKFLPLFFMFITFASGAKGTQEPVSETAELPDVGYPQRIVSLSPSTTETLFAIGAGDQLVGVTSYCDYPLEATTREVVGGFSAKTISIETIISLNPDLVIAGVSAHQPIAETLKQAGIAVISLEPKSVGDVQSIIEELAIITGHEEQGKAVSDDITNRLKTVQGKLNAIDENQKVRVFYEVWDAPLMTAGPESFTGQLLKFGGAINIFSDVDGDYPQISSEELISRNPQVIISSDTHGDAFLQEAMDKREGWQEIDAFKNNNIILLDGNIVSRPGPRMIDAIEMIAESLYPDLF